MILLGRSFGLCTIDTMKGFEDETIHVTRTIARLRIKYSILEEHLIAYDFQLLQYIIKAISLLFPEE